MINSEEKYKHIKVVDNCVPPTIAKYLEDICVPHKSRKVSEDPFHLPPFLTYTFNPTIAKTSSSPGMSVSLSSIFPQTPCKGRRHEFEYLFLNTLYSASSLEGIIVENVLQSRVFLHMPSPNPGLDDIHVDVDLPHQVFLYYVNDSDGDTVFFKDDKKTEIKRVTPKKGRGVFFNGSINHCSTRPFKSHRCIFNYDFLGIKLDKK